MNTFISWFQNHFATPIKWHFARKACRERRKALNELIRIVISFDENTGSAHAYIKYRDFIIYELSEYELYSANRKLRQLRLLNRHTII